MSKSSYELRHDLKVTAPAKINLHLEVLGLRKDGFHELAMVMQSIDLADHLDMRMRKDGLIKLDSDDSSLSNGQGNLIFEAAQLLKMHANLSDLGASIFLQKRIPIGAGLAGGSSDAAATLVGLNSLWGLNYSINELEKLGSKLGSDVPFCIRGGTQLCFGRGECLEPLKNQINSMAILLVKDPLTSVSTPWAYSQCKKINSSRYLTLENEFEECRERLRRESWLNPLSSVNPPPLRNDLQGIVAPVTPAVQKALRILFNLPGTLSVAMSGSGPSCFALYSDLDSANEALIEHRVELQSEGLDGWCCSLKNQGVILES